MKKEIEELQEDIYGIYRFILLLFTFIGLGFYELTKSNYFAIFAFVTYIFWIINFIKSLTKSKR